MTSTMRTVVLSLALLSCAIPSSFAYYVVQQSFLIESSCQGGSFYKNILADNCFRGAQVNTNYIYNCTSGSTYTCSIYVYNGNDCVTSFASRANLLVGSCSDGSLYTRSDNIMRVTSASGSFVASGVDPAGNKCSPSVLYSVPLSPACVALDPNVGAYIYTCDTTTANQTRTTQCNGNTNPVYTLSRTCGSNSFAITDAGPCATLPVATTTSAFAAATSQAAVSTSTTANSFATSTRSVSTTTAAAQSTAGRAANAATTSAFASTTSANTVTTSTFARATSTSAANSVTLSGASTSTSQFAATTNAVRTSTTAQANAVTTSAFNFATTTANNIAINSNAYLTSVAATTSQLATSTAAVAIATATTTGRVNDASTLLHKPSLVPLVALLVVLAVMF